MKHADLAAQHMIESLLELKRQQYEKYLNNALGRVVAGNHINLHPLSSHTMHKTTFSMQYSIIFSSLVALAAAHGTIRSITGANGVVMPGLSSMLPAYYQQ